MNTLRELRHSDAKNEYPMRIEEFKGKKLVVQVLSGFLRLHVSIGLVY